MNKRQCKKKKKKFIRGTLLPPGKIHTSKKDYNRKDKNKIEEE
jgi:hypothetical protein